MREITGYPSLAARLRCRAAGTYTPSNGGVTSKSTAYSFYRNMNWATQLPDSFEVSSTHAVLNGTKELFGDII